MLGWLIGPPLGRAAARLAEVLAVVLALRLEVGGQRQRVARLGVAAHALQGAAEAEQRVVVGRRVLHNGLELLGRLAQPSGAEQRPTVGLADRVLVRREVARAAERDGGGVVVALLEQLGALAEQLVDARLLHASSNIAPPPGASQRLDDLTRTRRQRRQRAQPAGEAQAGRQLPAQGPALAGRGRRGAAPEAPEAQRAQVALGPVAAAQQALEAAERHVGRRRAAAAHERAAE